MLDILSEHDCGLDHHPAPRRALDVGRVRGQLAAGSMKRLPKASCTAGTGDNSDGEQGRIHLELFHPNSPAWRMRRRRKGT